MGHLRGVRAVRDRLDAGTVGALAFASASNGRGDDPDCSRSEALIAEKWLATALNQYHPQPMIANKNEVLAAALDQTNNWLASEALGPTAFQIQLVTQASVRNLASQFEAVAGDRHVDWNWERIFFKKVRHKDAWMYAVINGTSPNGFCYGKIEVKEKYVSLEYLERAAPIADLQGRMLQIAFQFARTVALLLDITEVRLNEPFPALVTYYEEALGAIRHPASGEVQYMAVEVQP